MQSVSSRIWTRVAVSISYDDNHYTTGTFIWAIYGIVISTTTPDQSGNENNGNEVMSPYTQLLVPRLFGWFIDFNGLSTPLSTITSSYIYIYIYIFFFNKKVHEEIFYFLNLFIFGTTIIYIYICVCVCVCVHADTHLLIKWWKSIMIDTHMHMIGVIIKFLEWPHIDESGKHL